MAQIDAMTSDVSYRLATSADYEGVMDIGRNIYSGNDYLPSKYHQYVTDARRACILAEVNGRIVGFEIFTIIDDGKSVIAMTGRVHADFRRRGILKGLEWFAAKKSLERYPTVKRMVATTINKQQIEKATTNPNLPNIVMQRPIMSRLTSARDMQNAMTARLVSKMSREYPLDQVNLVTSSAAFETLTQRIDQRKFIPEGLWIVNYEPYGAFASSYRMILEDSSCFATYACETPHRCIVLSFGTGIVVPQGFRYRIELYCDSDVTDVSFVIAHIWKHIIYLNQFKQSGKISIGATLPSEELKVAVETFFDEELLMVTSDVLKGVVVAVEQEIKAFIQHRQSKL